jgi:2-polyprenyl-3-methyl-5-hydroxy-6-metoxy-1,4-benzoquinol methylase
VRDPLPAEASDGAWRTADLERVGACPACGGRRIKPYLDDLADRYDPDGRRWSLDRCASCGSAFINPRPIADQISRIYEAASYYTHEEPADPDAWPATFGARLREGIFKGYVNANYGYHLAPSMPVGRFVLPLLPGARGMVSVYIRHLESPNGERKRVLDLGCGNGGFLVRMRQLGWEVEGIDPDEQARTRAAGAGIPVRAEPLTVASAPRDHYDGITLNHVVEHLHEPRETLRACLVALRPGGVLWIATPNVGGLGARRYGRWWYPLDPPRHLVLPTRQALHAALREVGFTAVADEPTTLHAARWTYRVSACYRDGYADPFQHAGQERRELLAGVLADLRAVARRDDGEELIVVGRKPAQ